MDHPHIPGYKIRREIGSGGMATVYLALQENLHREVALKVMIPGLSADEIYCHRFLKEGRIAAQLSHQNLLTVYDIGVYNDEFYYMASEYLPGGTVRDKMSQGITIDEILQVMFEMGQGLEYAHSKGFVHRDLKPGNMFYRANGESVLGDFGIAKSVDSTTNATKLGTSIGTPHYMSPEQAKGDKVDHRSDLYSLGIVFYELLTGRPPFDAEDPFTVALMQINEEPESLPRAHAKFQPVMDRLLNKDREQRYPNAEEFLIALEEITGESAPARRTTRRRISVSNSGPQRAVATTPEATPAVRPVQKKLSQQIREREVNSPLRFAKILAVVMLLIAVGGTGFVGHRKGWFGGSEPSDPTPPTVNEDRINALLAAGDEQFGQGRFFAPASDNAYDSYQRVLRLDSDNERALAGVAAIAGGVLEQGREALAAGEFDRARSLASEGLRRFPGNERFRQLQGDITQAVSAPPDPNPESDPVVADTDPVPADPGTDTEAEVARLLTRANRFFDSTEIIEAARDFQRVLTLDPGNEEATAKLSRIADYWATAAERFIRLGNRDRAAQMIEKGLEATPDHPRLLTLKEQLSDAE